MALVAFSRNRIASQEELHPFERLAAGLSSSFSTLAADEGETAVAQAVEDIGMAFGVDECTLLAFIEGGSATVVHSWAVPPLAPCRDEDLAHMPWLIQRLSRNAVVALTPEMDLPHAAASDRAHAQQSGVVVRLGVPIAVGVRVTYAIVVAARQRNADWRTPVVDRLRLAGEIVGSGLERRRLDDARQVRQVERDADERSPSADLLYLQEEARNKVEADQIVGESSGFRAALARLGQVAPLDATVLLLGETGTGKELFALALHDRSRRRARMLVRVNCAALPASLIESELFGHERGAFTGAISTRQGRFELADGGTIFLDEIGDLAPELQAKLLRVLQEGEFERVGSSKVRKVDVRVIAATHINLEEAVAAGRFRADLYYRLSVFPIQLPALRERRDDIPQLVWFFIHRRQRELGRRIVRVPASVMQALQRHDWPGNVRELENVVERAMIRSVDGTLQLDDAPRADRSVDRPPEGVDSLDAVQRFHIERVLRECGGRINGVGNAAARLGIHPNTLRFRIAKLGVVMPERKPLHAGRPGAARLD
jgi:formate hydrogenlyase transcriptional activator